MPALESRNEGVWVAAQTGRGAGGAPASGKRLRKVGGDLNVARADGSEQYSDAQRFPDATDFVDTIVGNGNPVAQATPDVVGYLAWLMCGQETVTGTEDPYEHVATPAASGLWSKWWKRAGGSIVLRQILADCRLTSLRIEGSSANKVVKVTPTFISLKAGEVFTADPVPVTLDEIPLSYTEGEGRFEIDGEVYRGHSAFAIVINDGVAPWYGDAVVPEDVIFGTASVDLEGITILVNQQGLERYNAQIYGDATPAAGTMPLRTIPALGSYVVDLQRGADRQLKIEVPGVKWSSDLAIAGNPGGGPVELALAGQARAVAGEPMVRITTKSADPAYAAS
jgi:hypothetical protein